MGGDGNKSIVIDAMQKEAKPKPLLIKLCKVDFWCQEKGSAAAGLQLPSGT